VVIHNLLDKRSCEGKSEQQYKKYECFAQKSGKQRKIITMQKCGKNEELQEGQTKYNKLQEKYGRTTYSSKIRNDI